jgi:hypothetical protein
LLKNTPKLMSIPIVPYYAFCNLAGEALSEELERLISSRGFAELVLFSDLHGSKLALLPVGAGNRYTKLADVAGQELDGLRPLCAMKAPKGGTAPDPAFEHEQELVRLEASFKAREHYLAECEHRIADVGQSLAVREALLEQREHTLIALEKDFFERSGQQRPESMPAEPVPPKESY